MKKTFLTSVLLILVLSLQFNSCKLDELNDDKGKFIVTVTLNNNAVQGANVELYDEINEIFLFAKTTNTEGQVVFDGLDTGTYSFECDYEDSQNNYYLGNSTGNKLRPGDEKHVNVELHLSQKKLKNAFISFLSK